MKSVTTNPMSSWLTIKNRIKYPSQSKLDDNSYNKLMEKIDLTEEKLAKTFEQYFLSDWIIQNLCVIILL